MGKKIFHLKNLKLEKISLLIHFIFPTTFLFIASSQIYGNDRILIN